jgi:hypothetical protein
MFKSEAQRWLEMQPKHTQEWLKRQPLWHDKDLWLFFTFGSLAGLLVGLLLGISI